LNRGSATLHLVATPIGNLGDFSPRAVETLRSCDAIACEDTRKVLRLLQPHDIRKPLLAYHEHNEQSMAPVLAERLANGASIALVCEAGTPAISDPAFRLVRLCRARGLPVSPVPGPCAAIAALSVSGLPSDAFLFLGFLPPKSAARKRSFETHRNAPYTLIFYESTHRIEKFLSDLLETLGPQRTIALAREMTKLHETFYIGTVAQVRESLAEGSQKGEFVVCIAREGYALEPNLQA
jgi:16S rRNA (cytidine1402-2'-O)-methyltransferase